MSGKKVVARNKRARHDYEILGAVEAGLVLQGGEVKSIRDGKVSLAEAFGQFKRGELFLRDMHIPEYSHAGYAPHEPRRPRKLLLHRRELRKLETAVTRGGLTMVPLQLYFTDGRAKVEMALVRGRKRHDKREALKGKAAEQEIRRASRR